MPMPMPFKRTFTLIELLVVIVVILILIALLSPGLQHAKSTARSAACQTKLKNMGTAMTLYRLDFDSWVPPARHGWYPKGADCNKTYDWVYRINLYFGLDVNGPQWGDGLNGTRAATNPFFCNGEPDRLWPDHYLSSYWIGDCWGIRGTYNMNYGLGCWAGQPEEPYQMTQTVVSPSSTMLYIDGYQEPRIDFSFWGFYKTRHGANYNRANLVYVDTHVSFISHGEMTELGGKVNDPFWNPRF